MKFKLLAGTHTEAGTFYKQGSVIESDHDLVGLFGEEKFFNIDSEELATSLVDTSYKPPKLIATDRGDGTYDVSTEDGRQINDEPLSRAVAQDMIGYAIDPETVEVVSDVDDSVPEEEPPEDELTEVVEEEVEEPKKKPRKRRSFVSGRGIKRTRNSK